MDTDPNVVQSRLSTRETSTLTVATVAASASLVVLQLTVTDKATSHAWLRLAGFLFALLGFLYRETTIYTADIEENAMLRRLQPALPHNRHWWIRAVLIRAILLAPAGAWIISLFDVSKPYLGWDPSLILICLSVLLWIVSFPALIYMIASKRHAVSLVMLVGLLMLGAAVAIIVIVVQVFLFSMALWGFGIMVYVMSASLVLTWIEWRGREGLQEL